MKVKERFSYEDLQPYFLETMSLKSIAQEENLFQIPKGLPE